MGMTRKWQVHCRTSTRPLANGTILVLWTAVCGMGVVKHRPDSILHCSTVTSIGSDGFAIITSQQFYHLVCEPPLPPSSSHSLPSLSQTSPRPSLLVPYLFFFAHAPHIHTSHKVGPNIEQLIIEKLECLGVTI